MNKITILGSGTSTGVPILGCSCSICQSKDPRNQRFRCSALLETKGQRTILIDASPDLRTQLLDHQVKRVDGAIITHDHADHTHGLDDLRPYCFQQNQSLPVYTNQETSESLAQKFPYIFQRDKYFLNKPILGGGIPKLDLHPVDVGENLIQGEKFTFFQLPHGHSESLAFMHEKLAYIVDCREIPASIIVQLSRAKLDLLVIDCLRYEPHQTHLHFELTLHYIKEIAPKNALLTHMGHELDYLDVISQLKSRGIKNVFPANDGLSFFYS
jgi:phosphoribosyl 1,2-cyclic phosphate phosphodiesterase